MRKSAIILILLLATSANATGVNWYIETPAEGGSDTNTGKSWAQSCATIAFLNDSVTYGDTVYFGSGEWLASRIIPPKNTSGYYTVYTCSTYTMASANLATIYSGDEITSWEETTIVGNQCYKASWTPSVDEMYWQLYPCIVGDDYLYGPNDAITDLTTPGYSFYNYTNDIIYIYPYGGGDPDVTGERILGSAMHGAVYLSDDVGDTTRYTEFFGLNFKMGHGGTVYFKSDTGIKQSLNRWIHCIIAHATGGTGNNTSVVYMGQPGVYSSDTLVYYGYGNVFRGCTIYSANTDVTIYSNSHAGSGATFYGMRQCRFDSCNFSLLPGSAVMWKGGGLEYYGNTVRFCIIDGDPDTMYYGKPTFTNYAIEHACGASRDSVYGCVFKNITTSGGSGAYSKGVVFAMASGECTQATHWCGGDFVCYNTVYNCNIFIEGRVDWAETSGCVDNYNNIIVKHNLFQEKPANSVPWSYDQTQSGPPVANSGVFYFYDKCDIDSNYWYDEVGQNFIYYVYSDPNLTEDWAYWTGDLYHDIHGDTVAISFDSVNAVNPWLGFVSDAPATDSMLIGDKWFTQAGAVQPVGSEGSASPSLAPFLK